MKRVSLWLPFSIFVVFFGVVAFGLIKPSDHVITSKMVGKPLPQFALQPAHEGQAGLTSGDFSGGRRGCSTCLQAGVFPASRKRLT